MFLTVVLAGLLTLGLVAHEPWPAELEVPLILDPHGDPEKIRSGRAGPWYIAGAVQPVGVACLRVRLATQDGQTRAVVLVRNTGKGSDNPVVFYALYAAPDWRLTEWAGSPHACDKTL